MDTRTRTASPSLAAATTTTAGYPAPSQPQPPAQDKISAYYSLVFPHFTFYIQTLSISIGRRCTPNPNAASSSTGDQPPQQHTVDVDLGALKSVSRLHAKIEYDQEEDRFVLIVIGRNGAWVDGVWAAAGTRAPLGERSQIQIASRTFHFVLPPPPPPEDSPSPSSQSSAHRARSPSVEVDVDVDVDITSISPPSSQPSHSPVLDVKPLPPSPEPPARPKPVVKAERPPELPNSNNIGKSNRTAANTKKRKKGETAPAPPVQRPRPEDIPPKPPFTYAQLIFRAIKDIGGKATLQEICTWIMNKHEYYRWADGAWMSSVRHNLSSGRAFLKMERCGGDRGKGFFWSVDERYSQQLEDQEAKAAQAALAAASGIVKEPKGSRKKDKSGALEPPLKRSIKGDAKGTPLPPPLTSAPLAFKTIATTTTSGTTSNVTPSTNATSGATTGVFAYPAHAQHFASTSTSQSSVPATKAQNPYTPLTQWNLHPSATTPAFQTVTATTTSTASTAVATPVQSPPPATAPVAGPSQPQPPVQPTTVAAKQPPTAPAPGQQNLVPDVHIPIILGPIPPTHPDYAPGHPNNSAKEGYMVLHERTLILDPDVFSGLTKENLTELEKMGARGALVVLTGHMVKALKERRAKLKNKDKANRKNKGSKKEKKPMTAPFTKVPLERRVGTPQTDAQQAQAKPQVNGTPIPGGAAPLPASEPLMASLPPPPPPITAPVPPGPTTQVPVGVVVETPVQDPGSPIINIEDSDDEAPASKRRKLDDEASGLSSIVAAS
ncbi:hypothetical protein CC1G_00022 [Coprinopsis cinerea okayama7|uniref:Uncharacterized protein n=1 Tax=Coprinopsis cinerea (strain Okayama-7 / 130 / ATCC MYA-4618 / FGSC 9003) TaxID=240176 RepID=A8NWG5_COPC7|nr:hypothetical protein CC1G_00022 [Coprinopsis cinerea okayama7\|eukprot:XP_001836886.1 hypothetical protein CC1G_00022 [Coprinopsis cinerea okayama7\